MLNPKQQHDKSLEMLGTMDRAKRIVGMSRRTISVYFQASGVELMDRSVLAVTEADPDINTDRAEVLQAVLFSADLDSPDTIIKMIREYRTATVGEMLDRGPEVV